MSARSRSAIRAFAPALWMAIAATFAWTKVGISDPSVLAGQAAEYRAERPKTIIELQQFRNTETVTVADRTGGERATLINLNPDINVWYVLTLNSDNRHDGAAYHLENPAPGSQTLHLSRDRQSGIEIASNGGVTRCDLWSSGSNAAIEAAQRTRLPYAPICGGRLYLRNRVRGSQTDLERVTDFLRDHVWGGDALVGFVRGQLYRDAFIEKGQAVPPVGATPRVVDPGTPKAALLGPSKVRSPVAPADLNIDLGRPMAGMAEGLWYPVTGIPGVYFSFARAQDVAPEILKSYRDRVKSLDATEGAALDYLVAFDLTDFHVGFALGTDHPRVNWSDRPRAEERRNLPGPDGIATTAPLVTNGIVNPRLVPRIVATFTGGFKREHGAFRYGAFATQNHGSHYGFIEQGTVFSKLQPGLATIFVLDDGTVEMKSWTAEDDRLLERIKFARQNGVPLIDYDEARRSSLPGALVAQWGPGNWSGTAEEKLRSLRAGICLQETGAKRFLIYGYFSSATPSAMARVFQAYGCRYAMHLDMNALEHTYLALYRRHGAQIAVEHLVEGMALIDKKLDDTVMPRFIGYPDDRDFFYLWRKETAR